MSDARAAFEAAWREAQAALQRNDAAAALAPLQRCLQWQPQFAALPDAARARDLQARLAGHGLPTHVLSGTAARSNSRSASARYSSIRDLFAR